MNKIELLKDIKIQLDEFIATLKDLPIKEREKAVNEYISYVFSEKNKAPNNNEVEDNKYDLAMDMNKAEEYTIYIEQAINEPETAKEIMRGGGNNGGPIAVSLYNRKILNLRISKDALYVALMQLANPVEAMLETQPWSSKSKKSFGNLFGSNKKTVEECIEVGHLLTFDHNIPNKKLIETMYEMKVSDDSVSAEDFFRVIREQSRDLITIEENQAIKNKGLNSNGTKAERDACCSSKIDCAKLWVGSVHA